MSLYTVSSIPLAPIDDLHSGTGTHQDSKWLVVPSSVPGMGKLQFVGQWVQVTTMLFQLNAKVVPNWFGVAIPHGITDFTKVNIFFHPMPAQAKYVDADYFTKGGPPGHEWTRLFYYMERLGYQLDGAARDQIIIMPFLTNAATDTGIFPNNWFDIVTDILTEVRSALGADDGSPLAISQVVVSSFSVGIVYSANFRSTAIQLSSYLAEVWDFDGLFSSTPGLSTSLVSTAQYTAIKYDQNPASGSSSYHVPLPRWSDYVAPPSKASDVHGLIRDYMFLHAASISSVGEIISGGIGTGTTGTTGEPPSVGGTPGTSGTPVTASGTTGTTGMTGATGTTGFTGSTGVPGIAPEVPPPQPGQPFALPGVPSAPPFPFPQSPYSPPAGGYPVVPPFGYPIPTGPFPAPSVPVQSPPTAGLPTGTPTSRAGCDCCCVATSAIVSEVAVTASTAMTAIVSIASTAKTKH